MPYLLPAGDAYTQEHWCYLVFVPAKEEYRRALAGSLVGLEVWNIWERDSAKRGQDAALAWKEANQLTLACMDGTMSCLDDILEELVAIREALSIARDCCDIPFIYVPDEETDPPIIDPGVGDPPDEWGDGEIITTWDDWEGYVCYYANIYVDNLLNMADSLSAYASIGAFVVMGIAALLAIGASLGLLIAVSYPAAAAIVSGLLVGGTAIVFQDTRDEIEAARDSIVCAIMQNTGLGDAVEDALGSGLAWDLFFQFLNYNLALETIYTGEYDGEYLEALTDDTCACLAPGEFDITFTFDADIEEWHAWGPGNQSYNAGLGNPAGSLETYVNNTGDSNWAIKGSALATALGISVPTSFTIEEVHWDYRIRTQGNHVLVMWVKTVQQWIEGFSSGEAVDVWHPVSDTVIGLTETNMNNDLVKFNHYGGSSTFYYCNIDNIRIVGRWD